MRHDPSFLELIRADLDDDTPRLVYADWLQQKGARYGAFITASCALATAESATDYGSFTELRLNKQDTPEMAELRARVNQLWRKNRKDWVPAELREAHEVRFRRGFIDHLTLDASQLAWPLRELAPAMTSLELRCRHSGLALDVPMLFEQVRCLRIYVDAQSRPEAEVERRETSETNLVALSFPQDLPLLRHPRFARVDELSIAGCTDRMAASTLASLPYRPTKLNVAHVPIGDAGWKTLAPWLETIDVLNARDTGITSEAFIAHLNPNLRALDLSGNALGEAAIDALCAALQKVEFLDLRGSLRPNSVLVERLRSTFGDRVMV